MLQLALKRQTFSPPELAALPRVDTHVPIYFRILTYFGKHYNLLSTFTATNQRQHLSHTPKDSLQRNSEAQLEPCSWASFHFAIFVIANHDTLDFNTGSVHLPGSAAGAHGAIISHELHLSWAGMSARGAITPVWHCQPWLRLSCSAHKAGAERGRRQKAGGGEWVQASPWNPVWVGNTGVHFRAILTAAFIHSRGLPEWSSLLGDGGVILCFPPAERAADGF